MQMKVMVVEVFDRVEAAVEWEGVVRVVVVDVVV